VEVDEENLMHFHAETRTNWPLLLAGRVSWAILATFIYHKIGRAEYHLFFASIMQRRLFRIRQAVPKAMRAAVRVAYYMIPALVVVALVSLLVVSPLAGSITGRRFENIPSARGDTGADKANIETASQSTQGSPSSTSSASSSSTVERKSNPHMDAFLRPRQRAIPATQFVLYLLRNAFQFVHLSLVNMNLFSLSHLFARFFELLLLTMGLEMLWQVSAIIHSERFSFDPCAQLSRYMNDGNSLLKSNAAILQSMRNTRRATPLIVGLQSRNKFVSSHALQDLLDLACHHPDRRADIYQDFQGGSWELISQFAIEEMDSLTTKLETTSSSSSGSSKDKSGHKDSKSNSSDGNKQSSFSMKRILGSLVSARKKLDDAIRKAFKFARPSAYDLSLDASLSKMIPSPAAMQAQMNMMMLLRATARLMSKSVFEDLSGTIASSGRIPLILTSMLSLFQQLESYSERSASSTTNVSSKSSSRLRNPEKNAFDGHGLASSFSHPLLATLSEAIYEITTTYYEHLTVYQFEPSHLPLLQKFLDFAI
jgi:hypothetical protein